MKQIRLFFLSLLLLPACGKELVIEEGRYVPRFVVEGWIESGGYPYVILTHNLPFFTSVDSAQLAEVIIRWAKVTVSSGAETEVLTLVRDDRFFPFYLYRGTSLTGKPGGRYALRVEYAGNTITAETHIPEPPVLDSAWFTNLAGQPGKAQLNIAFTDPPGERNFYRIYTKLAGDDRYSPTVMPNIDDRLFNGESLQLAINRGPEGNLSPNFDPYFSKGDTVMVKLATIPEEGFVFWNSFQNILLTASNPLMGSAGEVKSFLKGPATGVWCGYGTSIYRVAVP